MWCLCVRAWGSSRGCDVRPGRRGFRSWDQIRHIGPVERALSACWPDGHQTPPASSEDRGCLAALEECAWRWNRW